MYRVNTVLDLLGCFIIGVLSYFAEIRFSIYIMWFALFVDLIVGLRKSRKIDNVKFSADKFKKWMGYVALATSLVLMVYATEEEMMFYQPNFYNGFIFIITIFTIYSIIKNGEALTGKYVFTILLDFINKQFKKLTGLNLKNKID